MKGIKSLIVAAIALAALAGGPSTASAFIGGVSAGSYPATLSGSGVGNLTLHAKSAGMTCTGLGFGATLDEASSSVTTTKVTNPTCSGANNALKMNGCQLTLNPLGSGSLSIGPSGCGPVEAVVEGCGVLTIPAQTGISAHFENHGTGSSAYFSAAINDSGVEYTNKSAFCIEKGTFKDMQIVGEAKVTATNASKAAIGTNTVPGGLYLAGGGEAGEPRLDAVEFPLSVSGERLDKSTFKTSKLAVLTAGASEGGLEVYCESATFNGGELTKPSYGGFVIAPAFATCTMGSMEVAVDMNSCVYEYSSLKEVSAKTEYESSARISCNKGDKIEIGAVKTGCVVDISAQALNQSAKMVNFVVKGKGGVINHTSGTAVEYTSEGFVCELLGLSNGSHHGGSTQIDSFLTGVFPG